MKFFNSTFFIVAIGSIIIISFSLLFYIDITRKIDIGLAEIVGSVSYKKKSAQRKYSGQVVWEMLEQNIDVYNNDSIRTADMSEAVIHLKDGTEIVLDEKSMILLALSEDQINIDFNYGEITAKRADIKDSGNKKINIKSGKTTISIDKSDLKLSHTKGRDLTLTVDKGEAKIITEFGEKVVKKYQKVIVSNTSKEIKLNTLEHKLNSPSPNIYFINTEESRKVDFFWEPIEGKKDIFLDVSKDKSFNNILITKQVRRASGTSLFREGAYFWRVRVLNRISGKTSHSDYRKFTIIRDIPVSLISPENNRIISFRKTSPIIQFKWRKSQIASDYKLIISNNPSMTDVLQTIKLNNNAIAIDSLIEDTYYWQIHKTIAFPGISHQGSSRIYKFVIEKKKLLEPPVLSYPPDKKIISKILLKKNRITFTWKKDQEITESKFLIASDSNFNNIVYSAVRSSNFSGIEKDLPGGKYYWRVIGISNNSAATKPSITRSFNVKENEVIKLISPDDKSIIVPEGKEKYPNIKFSWNRTDVRGKFHIEISRNKKFSPVYISRFGKTYNKTIQNMKPGKYFWKVALQDNEDKTILMKSIINSIHVKERLNRPGIVFPGNGALVNMRNKETLTFAWKRLKGANEYKIELYHLKSRKKYSIIENKTNKTNFKIDELSILDEGQFFWKLQAFDVDKINHKIIRKSPVHKAYFKITLGKQMKKPRITSPEIIYVE